MHAWTQNNAIIVLSSNRKLIIMINNVLYSIWKQYYEIDIGQFGTEDIGIRLSQFMCLMFLLMSWMIHPWRWTLEKRQIIMQKLCLSFSTFRPIVWIRNLNETKHSIDKGFVSCCTLHVILNTEQIFSYWMFG